jgi:hypothetical protein
MKVLCLNSCATADFSYCADGEYDLSEAQLKAAGKVNFKAIAAPKKPAPKPRKTK